MSAAYAVQPCADRAMQPSQVSERSWLLLSRMAGTSGTVTSPEFRAYQYGQSCLTLRPAVPAGE